MSGGRGTRRATHRGGVKLTVTDWQRLLVACPIKRAGTFTDGDFLACVNVSTTQFSLARHAGGCTCGNHYFKYLPELDMLVREDFHQWAMRNWRGVIGEEKARHATETGW